MMERTHREQTDLAGTRALAGTSSLPPATKDLPDVLVACVGGGSNSIGLFHDFMEYDSVRMLGVEAGGHGAGPGEHAVRMTSGQGRPGVVQAYRSIFLQDDNGSLLPTASISAGLDYAGIGPELAWWGKEGRVEFVSALDREVLEAVRLLARTEGILPALESAHALVEAVRLAKESSPETDIVVNVSGRGDKDLFITAPLLDGQDWLEFLQAEVKRLEGMH
jgi:tryptophan synthase beta chain